MKIKNLLIVCGLLWLACFVLAVIFVPSFGLFGLVLKFVGALVIAWLPAGFWLVNMESKPPDRHDKPKAP